MLLIDFETKSPEPLPQNGAYKYALHPETDVICAVLGFIDSDEPPQRWTSEQDAPQIILSHAAKGGIFCASNASFDRLIYQHVMTTRYSWPWVSTEQWYCTQAESRANGLPSKLEDVAYALDLPTKKSTRGATLIRKMCIPTFEHTPELLAEMIDYCEQDWIVTALAHQKINNPLSEKLQQDYVTNEEINDRGFCIDRELAIAALEYREQEQLECTERLCALTSGYVKKHTQRAKFNNWLIQQLTNHPAQKLLRVVKNGEEKWSIDKTCRENLLNNAAELEIPADIIDAVECYDTASGTSTAKYEKLLKRCCDDGRVRGVFRAFGAPSTLRYSSIGVQVHNLYRDTFNDEHVEQMRDKIIKKQPLTDPITNRALTVTETLSKLLRSTIIAAPGHVFVSADWSAIESRMTAWLAKDEDKLDVFRRGECPYCYAAGQIYGRKITKEENPEERQVGKVTDLACGFLGASGALRAMSRNLGVQIPDDQQLLLVNAWRARHPAIVVLGNNLQKAAEHAMRYPGLAASAYSVTYQFDGYALSVVLPDNETKLIYPAARLEYNDETRRAEITALKASFKKRTDDEEWPRHTLWRGLLLENIVQATCAILMRDILYKFGDVAVLHIHDEPVLEVREDEAEKYRDALHAEMKKTPIWAAGLPLEADVRISKRFGK